MNGMVTQTFNLYSIGVQVDTDVPELASEIGGLLRRFAEPAPDNRMLRFIYKNGGQVTDRMSNESSDPGRSLLFSTSWENDFDLAGRLGIDWDVYAGNGGLLLDYHQRGRLWLDTSGERLEGSLADPIELHHALLPSIFFYFPFAQLLARRSLYIVHAAALERRGRGVLIPGISGSGKSTCCVSLM